MVLVAAADAEEFRANAFPAGFLFWTLVDLDGAFEVGAVFDHDAGSSQVTVDRTILFDFNSILRAKVALHVAVHHYLASNDVGGHFRRGSDSQLSLIELNQSFDRAIDQQIFVAGDLHPFHVQAGPDAAPWRGPRLNPMDASDLYSSRVYPPKSPERASAADSFVSFLYPGCPCCGASGFLMPHIGPPKGQHHPTQISGRGTANCIPRKVRGKLSCEALFPDSY